MFENETLIMQKFIPGSQLEQIAKAVLYAQDIIEESWDIDQKKYTKTKYQGALEACNLLELDPFWVSIINNWLLYVWNDIQAWAEDIRKAYVAPYIKERK